MDAYGALPKDAAPTPPPTVSALMSRWAKF